MAIDPKELVAAIGFIIHETGEPVTIAEISDGLSISSGEVFQLLWRAKRIGAIVTYRYPPIHGGAITAVAWKDGHESRTG